MCIMAPRAFPICRGIEMQVLKPQSSEELVELVQDALAAKQTLELIAGGSKRHMGRPVEAAAKLDLNAFSGVTLYEPQELVLTAGAATPMSEIEALLAEQGQQLAFEPPNYNALLDETARPTLGGVLSANLAGPRRLVAGAARDHLLGFHAVSGRGEGFKAGGRVVKNVTGYDLSKLVCGAWGTLCALTQVSVKVLPRAEHVATLLFEEASAQSAVAAMALAMGSPQEVSGAAYLPASLGEGAPVFALRLEGVEASVAFRVGALRDLLVECGAPRTLDKAQSLVFWQKLRDAEMLAEPRDKAVWKVSVPPASGAALLEALPAMRGFLDWAGGLAWLALDPSASEAVRLRGIVASVGGHATLVRGPVQLRREVPVFEPPSAAVALLSQRIKENFDPEGIFNPGRIYPDM